jgi:hypothetical protein
LLPLAGALYGSHAQEFLPWINGGAVEARAESLKIRHPGSGASPYDVCAELPSDELRDGIILLPEG